MSVRKSIVQHIKTHVRIDEIDSMSLDVAMHHHLETMQKINAIESIEKMKPMQVHCEKLLFERIKKLKRESMLCQEENEKEQAGNA